jgi:hypothetical protein
VHISCLFNIYVSLTVYNRSETDVFGGFADTHHGNAFAGDMGFFAEAFERIDAAVMGGDHAEAGETAVHDIVLEIMWEDRHYLSLIL